MGWNIGDMLNVSLRFNDFVADFFPKPHVLEVKHEVMVYIQVFAGDLLRENTCANLGSMPGVVPATSPIFAFGATAINVAFRIPFLTFSRRISQLMPRCRLSFITVSGIPRSRSSRASVSIGTFPRDHPDPLKFWYEPLSS